MGKHKSVKREGAAVHAGKAGISRPAPEKPGPKKLKKAPHPDITLNVEREWPFPVSEHELQSERLGQGLLYKRYGTQGVPVVAFPTSEAHYTQWEDFGMVEALSDFIESGAIQLWTVDTYDNDTFFPLPGSYLLRGDAINTYEAYMDCLHDEFFPMLGDVTGQEPLLTGCSMGGYHSGNYFLRYPEGLAGVIALSGIYSLNHFLGDVDMDLIAANSPLEFLNDEVSEAKRWAYRNSHMVFCVGQGDGEQDMLDDTEALFHMFAEQEIPAWVDIWGESATHDWPWWKEQITQHLTKFLEGREPPLLTTFVEGE